MELRPWKRTKRENLDQKNLRIMRKRRKSAFLRTLIALGVTLAFSTTVAFASPILKTGSEGSDVLVLQKKLYAIGYNIKDLDGVFGQETKAIVLSFQRDQKIRATGIVNNATWRALRKARAKRAVKIVPKKKAPSWSPSTRKSPYVPNGKRFLDQKKVGAVIWTAKKYIGTPYRFGGNKPGGFDCSGLLEYVFHHNGYTIPRTADLQYNLGTAVRSQKQLVRGDLVFFETYEPGPSHCGIYLGGGKFIHASSMKGVRIDELSNSYWAPRYLGGKHIIK